MAANIIQLPTQVPAMVGILPSQKFMIVGDSLATVTTAGYLNQVSLESNPVSNTDIIQCLYNYNLQTTVGTYGVFTVSINGVGTITLSQAVLTGDVTLPVVSGNLASFNGTTGTIQDSGVPSANIMQNNITNTLTASGRIIANKVNGTEAANAVTASGMAGALTTSVLTTAGGSSYAITWTNTFITATSSVLLTLAGGTNTTENITLKVVPGAGSATLTIYNNTAATALNGTIIISYLVI